MISTDFFSDPYLERLFRREARNANCVISGHTTRCIDPVKIKAAFDNVTALYTTYDRAAAPAMFAGGSSYDEGLSIWEAIENDFGVFSPMNDQEDNQAIIEILYSRPIHRGNRAHFLENPVYRFDADLFDLDDPDGPRDCIVWDNFKNELKHGNRFFPANFLDFKKMKNIFRYRTRSISSGEIYYRARISNSQLPTAEMGPPPAAYATEGRANPKGISYLYLGSNGDSCKREIKINSGGYTLGKFEVTSRLKIVDLRNHYIVSPFFFKEKIKDYIENIELMKAYVKDLSQPTTPIHSYFDYLPTQYICELIKKNHYDGILFQSSLSMDQNDVNLTLFNESKVRCVDTEFLQVP